MIEVTGEQFWWRICYPAADGTPAFETANELRLPVGKRVAFSLKAADVIHSFWIPVLGGQMDMIPGRTNTSSSLPTRAGVYRAPCAEFCGTSHALMAFSVIVMEPADYAAWRRAQATATTVGGSEGKRLKRAAEKQSIAYQEDPDPADDPSEGRPPASFSMAPF